MSRGKMNGGKIQYRAALFTTRALNQRRSTSEKNVHEPEPKKYDKIWLQKWILLDLGIITRTLNRLVNKKPESSVVVGVLL